jgi:hypothetical protein
MCDGQYSNAAWEYSNVSGRAQASRTEGPWPPAIDHCSKCMSWHLRVIQPPPDAKQYRVECLTCGNHWEEPLV